MTDRRVEVLVDVTRTVQSAGSMTGTVRVESELAAALLAMHPDAVVPVSWSSSDQHFVELDRDVANRYLSRDEPRGDVSGPPLAATRPSQASTRRILLVAGNGWLSNIKLLHGTFHTCRALDAELHVVEHDLVHVLFPQWAPPEEALRCASAHEAMLAGADRLLAISASTARDIAIASAARGLTLPDVARIVNGTTRMVDESAGGISPGLASLDDRPFVLYVSTIAIRKNHSFIAQVWTRLAAELGPRLPRLVLVGQVAPDQHWMMERLARDPALADHVVHLSAATDADIAWLYAHSAFTVFPSLYEGWGLPVAESLAVGKVCLASNTSSIPEVAADATPLLDPLDVRAWCDAVRTFVLDPPARQAAEDRARERFRPISWARAADVAWRAMTEPLRVREPRRQPLIATSTPRPQPIVSLTTVREPWRPLRPHLGLATGHRTRLALPLDRVEAHGLRVALSMRNAGSAPVRVETDVNSAVADGGVIDAGERVTQEFVLPRDVVVSRGMLDIVSLCRPLAGPPPTDAHVEIDLISAVPLTREEETAALDTRRDTWRLGCVRHFTAGTRHHDVLKSGWDEPAHWGAWTLGDEAAITFRPSPPPNEPLMLRAIVRGFVPLAHQALDVEVRINGAHATTWNFRHPADFLFVERRVVIAPEQLVDGVVHLQLCIPQCRSPRELGMGADERRLGIGLARALVAAANAPLGTVDPLAVGKNRPS